MRNCTIAAVLLILATVVASIAPVVALQSPIWTGQVSSTGEQVVGPILLDGREYRIVVSGSWLYDEPNNLAADSQYYTTNYTNSVFWEEPIFVAPTGHSFLQINGLDIDWGSFSNGDTNHTYTAFLIGDESAITFRIVDWLDGNYTNNVCHISLQVFVSHAVGGAIVEQSLLQMAVYGIVVSLVIVGAVAASTSGLHIGRHRPKK